MEEKVKTPTGTTPGWLDAGPRWVTLGPAMLDARTVTGLQGDLIARDGRSIAVTDIHLTGTVIRVEVPLPEVAQLLARVLRGLDVMTTTVPDGG